MEPGAHNRCSQCGYCLDDLSPAGASVRCPECGLEQVPRLTLPFPGVGRALWRAVKPALIAYSAAALLVVLTAVGSVAGAPPAVSSVGLVLVVVAALVALLCSVVAPVVWYSEISADCDLSESPAAWGAAIVLGGWLANAFLTLCYAFAVALLATLTN